MLARWSLIALSTITLVACEKIEMGIYRPADGQPVGQQSLALTSEFSLLPGEVEVHLWQVDSIGPATLTLVQNRHALSLSLNVGSNFQQRQLLLSKQTTGWNFDARYENVKTVINQLTQEEVVDCWYRMPETIQSPRVDNPLRGHQRVRMLYETSKTERFVAFSEKGADIGKVELPTRIETQESVVEILTSCK